MKLLTVEQVAKETQFCVNTIKQAIKSGELRHGKFGRLIRIREEDLALWIARQIEVTMRSRTGLDTEIARMQAVEKTLVGGQ